MRHLLFYCRGVQNKIFLKNSCLFLKISDYRNSPPVDMWSCNGFAGETFFVWSAIVMNRRSSESRAKLA